jgi:hypothetical protein
MRLSDISHPETSGGCIYSQKLNPVNKDPCTYINVQILNLEATAIVDEGATHSAISGITARKLETLGIMQKPTTLPM